MLQKLQRTNDGNLEIPEAETVSDVEREEDMLQFLDRMLEEQKIRNQKKSSEEPNIENPKKYNNLNIYKYKYKYKYKYQKK